MYRWLSKEASHLGLHGYLFVLNHMNTTRKTELNSLKVQFLVHKNEGLFEIFVDETQKLACQYVQRYILYLPMQVGNGS